MKTLRRIVALTAVAMLCGVGAAQNYFVQVNQNTNLRQSYSLDSGIVATARRGTTLHVVGKFNRWYKINYNGGEVWAADWLSYTRVEGAGQPASQPASDIDNCCFVDRQCNSDQDWTAGYWAFQNGQCAAPAPVQSNAPAQSGGAAPANVDNCCFLGWACNSEFDWQAGFHAFQNNQCQNPGVTIEGSPGFVRQMENGFALLKRGSIHWYNYAIGGLNKVWQTPPEVIGVDVGAASFGLDYDDEPPPGAKDHDVWTASMFVHEACHVYRYRAGLEPGGYVGEKACTEIQLEATLAFAPNSRWNDWLRTLLSRIDDPAYQWWLPGNYGFAQGIARPR